MARNDVVLLDSIAAKFQSQAMPTASESESFELFCFDQVLKDYELSFEELESGWTDGPEDGGIDGFFVLVDGMLPSEDVLQHASHRSPRIEIHIFTVRKSDAFQQDPLNSIAASLLEILDLTKEEAELKYPFRQEVLDQRSLLKSTLQRLADRRPTLSVKVAYCCRGDTSTIASNLTTRSAQVEESIRSMFSRVEASLSFLGASELLELARRQRVYSLRLPFIESFISRGGSNYIVLATLGSYYKFVTDEQGKLRRYLFDSNVRDYLGAGSINRDITSTLMSNASPVDEDFWWLNNGVTVLATHATVIGKELSLENVQIVNGLQTTETLYRHFAHDGGTNDERAILVKVLLTAEEGARARIVKATNYQSAVELSSLRGLDKIQIDIEHFLADHNWYYDRRKNYYKNQGKHAERIVSIPYVAAAVRAIALRDPARSQSQRSRSLRDDEVYSQVFNPKWDLRVYLASVAITQAVETALFNRRSMFSAPPISLVHFVAYAYVCAELGRTAYDHKDVAKLSDTSPTPSLVLGIRAILEQASRDSGLTSKRKVGVRLEKDFIDDVITAQLLLPGWRDRVMAAAPTV